MWLRFPPVKPVRQCFDSPAVLPSSINTICENTLIAGYSCQARQTETAIVQEVAIDLCLEAAQASTLGIGPLEMVLGLLAPMIEKRDDSLKKSSSDFKTETGAKTI
jgi:hypothetical protein